MGDTPDQAKLQAMHDAALDAFLTYGFKRTTMEDIAQAAGMSRAALYLHFRNKRDVFRSTVQGLYDQGIARMEAALDPAQPVAPTLARAILAKDGKVMERITASPHGPEIMGIGKETTADIVAAGETRIRQLLAVYFGQVMARSGPVDGVTAEALADYVQCAHGAMHGAGGAQGLYADRIRLLARSVAGLLGA